MKRFWLSIMVFAALTSVSCGKKQAGLAAFNGEFEEATFGVDCIDTPMEDPARKVDPWSGRPTTYDPPLPESIPLITTPIDVDSCNGFGGAPSFPGKMMPGLIARVDCNAGVVHFRTRDYQVFEVGRIAPTGDVDVKVLYITRLLEDVDGTPNCWRRFLGHIQGKVNCPAGSPKSAHLNYRITWTVDETPAEIMENPTPGQADHRNGKFCRMGSGNCKFVNAIEMGCGG